MLHCNAAADAKRIAVKRLQNHHPHFKSFFMCSACFSTSGSMLKMHSVMRKMHRWQSENESFHQKEKKGKADSFFHRFESDLKNMHIRP